MRREARRAFRGGRKGAVTGWKKRRRKGRKKTKRRSRSRRKSRRRRKRVRSRALRLGPSVLLPEGDGPKGNKDNGWRSEQDITLYREENRNHFKQEETL